MEEELFVEELKEMNFYDGLNIKVYYTLDDEENVILDEEEMREEFEDKLKEIKEILD